MGSIITGTGMFAPETVVTNDDLARLMDTSDEWIRTRSGVTERRLAAAGEGMSDLAARAGRAALDDAGVGPEEVDALVVATMTPDVYAPGSAPLVQQQMGLGSIPAYDLRQQCSGFVYALDLADGLLRSAKAATVLIIGAEVHAGLQSWVEDWRRLQAGEPVSKDAYARNTSYRGWGVLFGDGAGAALLRRSDGPDGILATSLHSDGTGFELIQIPAIGSRFQPFVDAETIASGRHMPSMQGGDLFRRAVRQMPEVIGEVLDEAGLRAADLDLVVVHQANERIVEGVRRALGLAASSVPVNIDRYGNTTAATLPILYHELRSTGRVGPEALVCFVAFGAGAHWGAVLYREPGG